MELLSYVLARDYGFAPNPFFGYCTLATCKPRIRQHASIGDWVIGTGAKTRYNLQGHLMFAMKVGEEMDFDSYWSDPRFLCKRPALNGSLKQLYGDNIYHQRGGRWIQIDSHHSLDTGRPNRRNVNRDTSVNRLLISQKFVYYGTEAPLIPDCFRPYKHTGEDICCPGQGYRRLSPQLAMLFENWLDDRGEWGVQGMPLEFSSHKRIG
jgi:hypothetical protein